MIDDGNKVRFASLQSSINPINPNSDNPNPNSNNLVNSTNSNTSFINLKFVVCDLVFMDDKITQTFKKFADLLLFLLTDF
ncbi:MAG: hypothetical protein EOP44_07480 [Sphingobacteriaceae bacterium]|nr:MAG: hypothetical protein EOP44_07480 [Sphingobacteriaceae bacterium]